MRWALDLARYGRGTASPNPMVGAVVVSDGEIVGEGYHRAPGRPHAEAAALRDAGELASGADLYVNLEPCCHHGRTPPCTEEIIESGVVRVFAAMVDPNPRVAGRGLSRLREAGVQVETGLLEDEAQRLNEAYTKYIGSGMPFVTLKMAMTLDGKIATRTGDSRWISGDEARKWVHRQRAASDAVLVGIGTALSDDPRLTCRLPECPESAQPLRVIADSLARLPAGARLLWEAPERPVLVACTGDAPQGRLEKLRYAGAQVETFQSRPDGDGLDLKSLLHGLAAREITSVLCEGGGELAHGLVFSGLVDSIVIFLAGKLIGGRDAPTPLQGAGVDSMDEVLELCDMEIDRVGEDLRITARIPPMEGES